MDGLWKELMSQHWFQMPQQHQLQISSTEIAINTKKANTWNVKMEAN